MMIMISKIIMVLIIIMLVELFLALQITLSNTPKLFVIDIMMRMISMKSDEGDVDGVLTMLGDVT